ncbi:MAG: DUF3822 family protein [Bacteroidota bacterium]|nr:DUF3822 family protein [Bacteroidota bacterium]
MNKIFEILPSSVEEENCILICEMSTEGFSFAIKDEIQNSFLGLGIYHFEKNTPPVGFPIALQILFHQNEWLSRKFKKINIVYSFPESVLIPFPIYDRNQNRNILNLVHGDLSNNDIIFTDVITGESLYNTYRVAAPVYDILQSQFPRASNMHQYSFLLKQAPSEKNKLHIIFYSKKMVVSLIKEGKHQLINSFNYRTAEDITYILLNICKQFEVENIDLEISGLLEKNSLLFAEIYKYFETIELTTLPVDKNYSEEITQHPAHYFSHLFALDSCE